LTIHSRKQMAVYGFLSLLVLLVAAPIAAQTGATTGAIVGTVADNTKGVLPGVTVTVSGRALIAMRRDVTNADGQYRIPALPPGEYAIVFDLPGFASVTRTGVRISVDFTATINVELNRFRVSRSRT
jgi:hypothetical protein